MYGILNILWHCLSLGLEWKLTFSSRVATYTWVFQVCWHIECSTFSASSFKIWNSSTGILSPPLPLFVVMLPKAHLALHSRMSGSRWVIISSWLSGSWRSFLSTYLLITSATLNQSGGGISTELTMDHYFVHVLATTNYSRLSYLIQLQH